MVDYIRYMKVVEDLRPEAPDKFGLTHSVYLSTEAEDTVKIFPQYLGSDLSLTHLQHFSDPHLAPDIAGTVGETNEVLKSLVSSDQAF